MNPDNAENYFLIFGEWMESDNISRNLDGNVPNVNWNGSNDKLNINYYNSDNSNDNLRSRTEVSREKPLYRGFSKYFIQPFIILDISTASSDILK
ncbi:MAG: hypothetical protein WC705_03265 [Candidatus Paceibacterota bacterium]